MAKNDKKRNSWGQGGQPKQLPNGKWKVYVSFGGSGANRDRRSFTGDSRQDVLNQVARAKGQAVDGLLVVTSTTSAAEYLRHWLDTHKNHIRESTFESYRMSLENHIIPYLETTRLQKLTAPFLESVLNKIKGNGARRTAYAPLRQALRVALKQGLIPKYPLDGVKRAPKSKKKMKVWDVDQCIQFLKEAVGHRREAAFVLALGTGARISEILAAKWEDFNLEKGTWEVRGTLSAGVGNTITYKEPKTEDGSRTIELDAKSLAILPILKAQNLRNGLMQFPWLFCKSDGSFLRRQAVSRNFHTIRQRLGLPYLKFHGTRHTHATILLLNGENPIVVQERLGHKDIRITLECYGHVTRQTHKEAVGRFNELFADSDGKSPRTQSRRRATGS